MYCLMKDMPVGEKPDDKAQRFGIANLSDAELLAVILRNGCNGRSVMDTAMDILNLCGGLQGLCDRENGRLQQIPGIGTVRLLQLQAVGEIARRIAGQGMPDRICFREPSDIYQYFQNDFRMLKQEEVWVLLLDSKLRMIRRVMVSKGTVNASLASPSDIFRIALMQASACFVLMHNHPSGDPAPSKDDISLTNTIRELGKELQLPLMDHIIFGSHSYYSFQENFY